MQVQYNYHTALQFDAPSFILFLLSSAKGQARECATRNTSDVNDATMI